MSDTVTISRNRAERVHLFLNEFAEYGYRFGLPKDLMELVGDCLIGEDTHASAWGIEDADEGASGNHIWTGGQS